jgi:rhamnogalacturonan endolyase
MNKAFAACLLLCIFVWSPIGGYGAVQLRVPTHVVALPQGQTEDGGWKIYVSWRLDRNNSKAEYHVYRSTDGTNFSKLTSTPISDSTNYVDTGDLQYERTYYYYITSTDSKTGLESSPSIIASAVTGPKSNIFMKLPEIVANPAVGRIKAGDIDGNGQPDLLVLNKRLTEWIPQEILDDDELESIEAHGNVHVMVFYNDGTLACDIDLGETNSLPVIPWTFWDLTGDGKDELIGIKKDPTINDYCLYVINPDYKGAGGYEILARVPVPSANYWWEPKTIKYKTIAIAYLDGQRPYILMGSGHQFNQRRYVRAYTYDGNPLLTTHWEFYEAPNVGISTSHQFEVVDIDVDGKDEAFLGIYTFDQDGLWHERWGGHQWSHADGVCAGYIRDTPNDDPCKERQELYFYLEQNPMGIHMTDCVGNEIKKWSAIDDCPQSKHAHAGWIGNVVDRTPGMEVWVYYKRPGAGMVCPFLYDSDGNKFEIIGESLHFGYGPMDWDGLIPHEVVCITDINRLVVDETDKSLLHLRPLAEPPEIGDGVKFTMDIIGDYREEIVNVVRGVDGYLYLEAHTNNSYIKRRKFSPSDNRQYLQKHRWAGH